MRQCLGVGAVLVAIMTCACGGAEPAPAESGGAGGAGSSGGEGPGAGSGGGEGPGAGGGTPGVPAYGRFGEARTTFTLPAPAPKEGERPAIAYPELTTSFPEVDWSALDRLYIPAGEYRSILLGGLPERSADRPLVITNLGGQVKVGGDAANHLFVLKGGKGWILTGRYDPVSKTGDAGFRGHAEGDFAHSQGTYGLFIDDAFSKEGLSGLAIGGGASDFELDTIEVARAEFAGVIAKTDGDGQATMRNVKIHDLYVHDVGSEGIYFGSTQAQPQHAFERLEVYDNRFLRTGTEALQVGQLGSDCEIHHNVLGPAAVRWRSAFDRYQDGNVQFGQRYGSSSFHHNIVIGTGDLFVELFPTRVDGDPRSPGDTIAFTDNYFADTSLSGVYTHAVDTGATIRFERNTFLGFHFNYGEVYPDTSEPVQVFAVGSNAPNPHVLRDNRVDGPYPFIKWLFDSVTAEDNPSAEVPRVRFRDFMGAALDEDYRLLEWWTDRATLSPDQRAVVYPKGAFVVHQGALYEALEENQGKQPDRHPDAWRALPPPADDVRLRADSPHQGLGVRWPPP
ncbi:right-handed parallel beta-helix repeat-containing protein [Sorangium sp. So ce513]|uniref:right-handed parallel beta-helix repeat-containing protein n=1 Tax=Sorangium sp. So ce513 TaxID=3133315 RepID=UPI003F5F64C1